MGKPSLQLVGFFLWTAFGSVSTFADFEHRKDTVAVQNRYYFFRNEFSLLGGVYPVDAIKKGLSIGGSYTYHFTDALSWEVINGHYVFSVSTNLQEQLRTFNIQTTQFPELRFLLSSNVSYNLLYGKNVLLNRKIIYVDIYVTAGGGVTAQDYQNERNWWPAMNVGLGVRYYVLKYLAIRTDIRNYLVIENRGSGDRVFTNLLYVAAGVSSDFMFLGSKSRSKDLTGE